jgi:hypothetical protein
MSEENELVRVYTGTEIKVRLLKDILGKAGIPGVIKNNFDSGLAAGFGGGLPSGVDLYINENQLDKANPIVKDFRKQNKD